MSVYRYDGYGETNFYEHQAGQVRICKVKRGFEPDGDLDKPLPDGVPSITLPLTTLEWVIDSWHADLHDHEIGYMRPITTQHGEFSEHDRIVTIARDGKAVARLYAEGFFGFGRHVAAERRALES